MFSEVAVSLLAGPLNRVALAEVSLQVGRLWFRSPLPQGLRCTDLLPENRSI